MAFAQGPRVCLRLCVIFFVCGCGSSIYTGGDDDSADDGAPDDDSGDDDTTASGDDDADDDSFDDDSSPDPPPPWLEFRTEFDAAGDDAARQDLIDGLGRTGRWPWVDGDRALFCTCWPEAGGVFSAVGDFNAWDPSADPAEVHDGCGCAEVESAGPLQGKYKWYAGPPEQWRAPPESTAYGWDEFGAFGWVAPPLDEPWLERLPQWPGPPGDAPRTVRLSFPAAFVAGVTEARQLLLHDGQNVFGPEGPFGGWQVDTTLGTGGWGPVVALAVDSVADRLDVYGHVVDLHPSTGAARGGRADAHLDWILDEVLPAVRARYQLPEQGLMVVGSSMGGLHSLWAALRRPEALACVGALSPSLGWGAYDSALDGSAALVNLWPGAVGHGGVPLYLDSGGGPGSGCFDLDGDGVYEGLDDSDGYCVTTQFRDRLEELGYSFDADLAHWWEPGAAHDEAAWRERFFRALDHCAAAGW